MPAEAQVLAFEQARRLVEQRAATLRPMREPESVDLLRALGRVLGEPVVADRDLPPFPRATRDGYAVRAADLTPLPARLKVVGEIRAGAALERALAPGEAAEIMTGAPAPAGADAVVMVEYTTRTAGQVEIQRAVSPGENIVPTGSEARRGAVLVEPGVCLGYAHIAAAASVGRAAVLVHARPRVAVLSTGDELVDIAAAPGPHQIRNSNSYSLAAQVAAAGGEPVQLPVVRDDLAALRAALQQAFAHDLVLLTGGVSMGKYDLVEQALAELHAEFFFTGALIQPGRPVVFGRLLQPERYFLGLPGNPVSTMVTFELFARPLLDALSGAQPAPLLFPQFRLKAEVRTRTGLTRFLPARAAGDEVERLPWQGSGDVASMARANCFLVVPPDRDRLAAGELVSVLLICS